MNQAQQFLHEMRQQPEHIRKRFMVGISVGATLVIAFFWVVANVSSGNFVVHTTPIGDLNSFVTASSSANSAVAAAEAAFSAPANDEPTLTVVETNTPEPTPPPEPKDPSVIPF